MLDIHTPKGALAARIMINDERPMWDRYNARVASAYKSGDTDALHSAFYFRQREYRAYVRTGLRIEQIEAGLFRVQRVGRIPPVYAHIYTSTPHWDATKYPAFRTAADALIAIEMEGEK